MRQLKISPIKLELGEGEMVVKRKKRFVLNSNEFDRLNARIKVTAGYYRKIKAFEKAFVNLQIELKMLKRNQTLLFDLVEKIKGNKK